MPHTWVFVLVIISGVKRTLMGPSEQVFSWTLLKKMLICGNNGSFGIVELPCEALS